MRVDLDPGVRQRFQALCAEVFDSGYLSDGPMLRRFEAAFSALTGLRAIAVCNGGAALQAVFERIGVAGGEVIVPANTFWATAAAVRRAGAIPVYADCERDDLCLSLSDLQRQTGPRTSAVCVTHIGGHIAFRIEAIAEFCRSRGIPLVEDCAHAHGASFKGRAAGSWGMAGAYSFYATKTMPLGEGGMVVTSDPQLEEWLRTHRNYGKLVAGGRVRYLSPDGFNYRMNEITAALGLAQTEALPGVLAWKRSLADKYDRLFENRVRFPAEMRSGYYKYIVFDQDLAEETGKVFDRSDFGNEIEGRAFHLPNSWWIAEHHRCAPIWHGWDGAGLDVEGLRRRLVRGALG
jgi:dTDP-4-amino-4,6-dideoxygalactose transaminase